MVLKYRRTDIHSRDNIANEKIVDVFMGGQSGVDVGILVEVYPSSLFLSLTSWAPRGRGRRHSMHSLLTSRRVSR